MVKRMCSIILPKADNEAHTLVWQHVTLRKLLCTTFGGYTAFASHGGWISPEGQLFEEDGMTYQVAADDNDATAHSLRDIAKALAVSANQQAIFIVHTTGDVEFVTA